MATQTGCCFALKTSSEHYYIELPPDASASLAETAGRAVSFSEAILSLLTKRSEDMEQTEEFILAEEARLAELVADKALADGQRLAGRLADKFGEVLSHRPCVWVVL